MTENENTSGSPLSAKTDGTPSKPQVTGGKYLHESPCKFPQSTSSSSPTENRGALDSSPGLARLSIPAPPGAALSTCPP
jgi:hypothetical protein